MVEAASRLVEFIKFNKWPLRTHNGNVSRDAANEHALRQLALFKAKVVSDGDVAAAETKELEKRG